MKAGRKPHAILYSIDRRKINFWKTAHKYSDFTDLSYGAVQAESWQEAVVLNETRGKILHTEYVLELCDTSDEHKLIARFQSSTLFIAVNVGDRIDDTGWDRLDGTGVIASPEQPRRYKLHSIKHLISSSADK